MNGSTTATSAITTIDDASHFAQTTPDSGDARPTTSMFTTTLDRNHFVTIEVVLDKRHDGDVLPFWKGYVLEHGDLSGSVAVGFARALDDSKTSRSEVVAKLNEMVCRNGYLSYAAVREIYLGSTQRRRSAIASVSRPSGRCVTGTVEKSRSTAPRTSQSHEIGKTA
jgi:hypothetical protein